MAGILVALAALCLGAWGPRLLWRGAALLALAMIGGGVVATLQAWSEADAAGLLFVITPGSVILGLIGQAAFALLFYAIGVVVGKGLALIGPKPPVPDPPACPDA